MFLPQRAALRILACLGLTLSAALSHVPVRAALPETALDSLSARLLDLQAGRGRTVRILHFGDSHVASGPEPAFLGANLQAVFGDGGPGLFMPWTPPPSILRSGVRTGCTSGWRRVIPRGDSAEDDSSLWGCYIECDRPGETAWAEGEGSVARVEYLKQPGGGDLDILWDGRRVGTASLTSAQREVGMYRYVADGQITGVHRLELRAAGGKVRILGAVLEKSSGLSYSPLGMNGARADLLLKCRARTFSALMEAEAPDVVFLAFGTNEAGQKVADLAAYGAMFRRVIGRIRDACPRAAVIVLGPPDRAGANAGLDIVIAAQREACRALGAEFFDQRAAMGGSGAFARWAEAVPALARPDGVHFTAQGYERLARFAAEDLVVLYNRTKALPSFQSALKRDGAAESLMALAGKPARLPDTPPALRAIAWPTEVMPQARTTEDSHAIYYFRNAQGVLVITDEPSYGSSSPDTKAEAPSAKGSGRPSTPAPYSVYYFLEEDGSLIITSDPESVKGKAGRFLTPKEVAARPKTGAGAGAPAS